ncbi:MAG: transporter substrate-binding domain-containing protein [Anaerolineae bacterium]
MISSRTLIRWAVGGAIVLLLGAVAVSLLVRGRGDDGTLERVQATGELRVGLDASFPPFESLDGGGNVVGFDPDLAQAIATRLDVQPVFVNVGFDGLYDALWAGQVDVLISGLPYDPRRTQDVNYSQPYFNAGQVLVMVVGDPALMSSSGMEASELLSGRVVAVEWGSLADMEARRLKQTAQAMQTLPQPTAQDALHALVAGQADAAIADAVSVYQFIGQGESELQIVATLTDEPYVIATRIKSRRLAETIDQALTELQKSGKLDELLERWF